jgi:hypothetical protein
MQICRKFNAPPIIIYTKKTVKTGLGNMHELKKNRNEPEENGKTA